MRKLILVSAVALVILAADNGVAFAQGVTYTSVIMSILTGNDDARADTELQATMTGFADGFARTFCLKASNNANSDATCPISGSQTAPASDASWNNWTAQAVSLPMTRPAAGTGFGTLTIRVISHNYGTETNDNWDLQTINVVLSNNVAGSLNVLSVGSSATSGDSCYYRFKPTGSPPVAQYTFALGNAANSSTGNNCQQ